MTGNPDSDLFSAGNTCTYEHVPLDQVVLPDRALRTHPRKQIQQIARSIDEFGWVAPIIIDGTNEVVAGTARVLAGRELGLTHAPAIRVRHLTPNEIRLYRIADNKLAESAEWDNPELKLEIGELITLDMDLTITGFEPPEIDMLLSDDAPEDDPADTVAEIDPEAEPIARQGDIWEVGPHRIACGDARDPVLYADLFAGETVAMVFTDPPYNVPVSGHMGGLGRIQHREFVMASGEMSDSQFHALLETALRNATKHSSPGAVMYACMDWRSIQVLKSAADKTGLEIINLCVWNKTNGGMGSLYRSKHELIYVFRVSGASHTNNVQLGRFGRNRTNVWDYPGANTPGSDSHRDLALHPTVKPIAMIADAILDVTHRGQIVLDMFGGVGSTLLAAERTGRRARLIELDPLYVDATLQRVREHTNLPIHLAATGQSFEEVRAERLAEAEAGIQPPWPPRYRPRSVVPAGQKGEADDC